MDKGKCIHKRCVGVPDGLGIDDARQILDEVADELKMFEAVESAVPEGPWDGQRVIENLRAAGYDVVRVEVAS